MQLEESRLKRKSESKLFVRHTRRRKPEKRVRALGIDDVSQPDAMRLRENFAGSAPEQLARYVPFHSSLLPCAEKLHLEVIGTGFIIPAHLAKLLLIGFHQCRRNISVFGQRWFHD